jgi:hypothetical protein
MWRIFKILMLLWPVPLMIYFIGGNIVDKAYIDKKLSDPNTLVWDSGDKRITFTVTTTSSGEKTAYDISLAGNDGQILFHDEFVSDHDMYGGGFVQAVQADDDQELELVVWGVNEQRTSYLLDYVDGQIVRISYDRFPDEIKTITREWHQIHIGGGMTIAFFGMFCCGYYFIAGLVWLFVKGVKRFKNRRTG